MSDWNVYGVTATSAPPGASVLGVPVWLAGAGGTAPPAQVNVSGVTPSAGALPVSVVSQPVNVAVSGVVQSAGALPVSIVSQPVSVLEAVGTAVVIGLSTIAPAAMTRMTVSALADYAVVVSSAYTIPAGKVLRLLGANAVVVCTATGATNFVNFQVLITTSGVVVTTGQPVVLAFGASVGVSGAMNNVNVGIPGGIDIKGTGVIGIAVSASSAGVSVAANLYGNLYP